MNIWIDMLIMTVFFGPIFIYVTCRAVKEIRNA
jgi:hypothetical protein